MKVAGVSASPGGIAVPALGTWPVATPFDRGFRTILYLRFDTSGTSDELVIDAAACQFDAVFQSLDYNALVATPAPALSLSKDGKAVIVRLDGPRRVLDVTLAAPPRTVELHRADGPVQADKAADPSNFTDANFAVQFAAPVAANQVTAINVRSTPANPRIAIAATDSKSSFPFWPTPNSTGTSSVSAGAEFAKALQAFVTEQWDEARKKSRQNTAVPLPQHVDTAVVIDSDAPCRLEISKFQAGYHRVLTVFSSSSGPKEVLRYSGKQVERQTISVRLPTSATVVSGLLRIDESFRRNGAAVGDNEGVFTMAAALPDRGLRITTGDRQYAAQRVEPSGSATIGGIALGVMALSPDTSLAVQIQSDYQGSPSGKNIIETGFTLKQAGVSTWVIAPFRTPIAFAAKGFWILVRAAKGDAIWLAESGDISVRSLVPENGVWTETASLPGLEALWRPLPQSMGTGSDQAAGSTTSIQRACVSIGSSTAAIVSQNGSRTFDLTSPLNAFLSAARTDSGAPETSEIPIVFIAGSGGLITVYPPCITYDI